MEEEKKVNRPEFLGIISSGDRFPKAVVQRWGDKPAYVSISDPLKSPKNEKGYPIPLNVSPEFIDNVHKLLVQKGLLAA